jgi:hypothetical protein
MAMNPRLLVPRATGFNPRSIAGLSLWLDAADSTSLTVSSGSVSQWRDKSGNSHNASQGVGLNQPDYIASGLNGKPVVRFDGTNHFLAGNQAAIGTNPVTVFFVGKTGGTSTSNYIVFLGISGAGTAIFFSGDRAVRFGNGNRVWNTAPLTTATLATYRNTSAQYDTFQSWDKGSLLTPSSTSSGTNSYNISSTLFGLGGSSFGANLLAGDIGEVLVYTRSLSDAERERVEAALLRKWGF